jgi:hypothetical protein
MANSITGSPVKRPVQDLKTPPTSPHIPVASPTKRAQSDSSIKGVAVEPLSSHKSPRKVFDQIQQQLLDMRSCEKLYRLDERYNFSDKSLIIRNSKG